jgi:hypothetical protein
MTVLSIAMLISVILIFVVILGVDNRIDKLTEELKLERHRINMLKIDVNYLWSELRNDEDNGGEGDVEIH